MNQFPNQIEFRNHLTDEIYYLVRAEDGDAFPYCAERMACLCNEPLIYNALFKETLNGNSYSINEAKQFLSWAKDGWFEKTHFVFFHLQRKE